MTRDYSSVPFDTSAWGLDGVLVVNVKSFTERRAHIEAELAKVGLKAEFVHEFDADEIDAQTDARYYAPGLNMTMGHKSCGLKHIAIMERVVQRNWKHCLVLEDDAMLHKDFRQGVERTLAELASYEGQPSVAFVGCGGNWYTPRSQRRKDQYLYPAQKGRLTDSYIIGAPAARLRLDWVNSHKMTEAIDNAFNTMDREMGITMLWLEPPVVDQGTKLGLFSSALEGRWSPFIQGLLHRWERLRRKYLYQLWR